MGRSSNKAQEQGKEEEDGREKMSKSIGSLYKGEVTLRVGLVDSCRRKWMEIRLKRVSK
jgi:hypothetical protein